ncbi:conserved hypothetical protein [Ricinus communis]|uniref:Uncharacterized protein n=1 Tax=Ricinus communis TaxID=3988 RepID=B9RT95_RICCO|nr:conserved hypothetical protein [Ricinus communis]
MASQKVDRRALEAAASEGFATIEARLTKKPATGRVQNPNHQRNEASLINSKEAAKRYGCMVIERVITSAKAAQTYGGVLIGPAISSDTVVQRYGAILIPDRPRDKIPRDTD